jgi:hypothetical protein
MTQHSVNAQLVQQGLPQARSLDVSLVELPFSSTPTPPPPPSPLAPLPEATPGATTARRVETPPASTPPPPPSTFPPPPPSPDPVLVVAVVVVVAIVMVCIACFLLLRQRQKCLHSGKVDQDPDVTLEEDERGRTESGGEEGGGEGGGGEEGEGGGEEGAGGGEEERTSVEERRRENSNFNWQSQSQNEGEALTYNRVGRGFRLRPLPRGVGNRQSNVGGNLSWERPPLDQIAAGAQQRGESGEGSTSREVPALVRATTEELLDMEAGAPSLKRLTTEDILSDNLN